MNEIINSLGGLLSEIETTNNAVNSIYLKIETSNWIIDITFDRNE